MRRSLAVTAVMLILIGSPALSRASDGGAANERTTEPAVKKTEAASLPGEVPTPPAPEERVQLGTELRFRSEHWNNSTDYNSQLQDRRNQFRFRSRFWMDVPVTKHIEFFVGLDNEFKKQTSPDLKIDIDELVFENLYVTLKDIGTKGLMLRVGRQNLIRGDGFILMDGTPGDGSRSMYSNAVNLAYTRRKSTIELFGILNPARDRMLPRINDKEKPLVEWDEQALGVYYTDKNHKNTDWESYYFYKKEIHDHRAATNPLFQPDRHVQTAGSRIVHRFGHGISSTTEGAVQWGAQHPSTDVHAWAGYGTLRKNIDCKWKPYVLAGYTALSGDDPNTKGTVEGWDPLFSRYPRWSDLYIYAQTREKAVSYWSNMHMSQAEFGIEPRKNLALRTTWYHMMAMHSLDAPSVFGSGTHRGDLFQARADYKLNERLRGHLEYEAMVPGTFYRGDNFGYFARAEIIYTWSKAF